MRVLIVGLLILGGTLTTKVQAGEPPQVAPSHGEPEAPYRPAPTAPVYFNPSANYLLGVWLAQVHYFEPSTGHDELGLYVNNVVLNGPAHRKGIERGDIIVRINGQRVTNLAEYKLALNATSGIPQIRIRNWRTTTYQNVDDVQLQPSSTPSPNPDTVP